MHSGTVAVFCRVNDSVGEQASKSTDPCVFFFCFFFVSGFWPIASHGSKIKKEKDASNICRIFNDDHVERRRCDR